MSESRKITFYHADDWVWVYADDRLVMSEHSCDGPRLLEALGYEDFSSHWYKSDVPQESIWDISHGPESHTEFPKELFD